MQKLILSAHKKPFKLERHALNAIKNKPGYVVEQRKSGFVGVFQKDQEYIPEIKQGRTKGVEGLSPFSFDVVCPSCGLSYNSTTKEYDPDIDANPAMLRLKERYKEYGWDEIPADATRGYGCLECPECGSALAPDGKLKVA